MSMGGTPKRRGRRSNFLPLRPLRLLLCSLCVAAALARPAGAFAQEAGAQELVESQKRLEQIRREREQLREEMEGIRSRVHDISSELRLLDREVSNSAEAIAELDFQLAQHQARIEQTVQDLDATRRHLEHRKSVLQLRLRQIYKRGPLHTVQVLLTADSFSDLLNRYKYLFLIARHDQQLVRDVATLESQLVARERLLVQSMDALRGTQEERASIYQELSGLQARQKRALSSARQKERATSQRITQLERDERRLTSLVASLDAARRAAERRTSTPTVSTLDAAVPGSLAWPVNGRLLYRFGRQTQPNGTVLRWNGIGIGARAGTVVRAVESGTVVMAGPFEGYGPSVVISHGGGYYSLYLYLRDVTVREGAKVTRDQAVGSVGGEATPEGAHIEFQIRAPGGEAVDPLAWLRSRGGA